ncbi:MAG: hypothetical protein JRH19_04665 [Deltaproteobacteria bacterium]|nr:hypothetical protein [Deltaproteobacteria bacterium]
MQHLRAGEPRRRHRDLEGAWLRGRGEAPRHGDQEAHPRHPRGLPPRRLHRSRRKSGPRHQGHEDAGAARQRAGHGEEPGGRARRSREEPRLRARRCPGPQRRHRADSYGAHRRQVGERRRDRPRKQSAVSSYDRKDHFHQRAKREGYRSRAAYKLLELQKAHRFMRPGQRVADLGCWPGGWLQVASRAVGPKGRVVGVDLAAIEPPLDDANVVTFVGDLEAPDLCERVLEALGGPANLLLSDAAPKLTGIREADRAREERILEAIEQLLPQLLKPGGDLLLKILEGPEAQVIDRRIRRRFEKAKTVKPKATRKGSTERYLFARSFLGDVAAE